MTKPSAEQQNILVEALYQRHGTRLEILGNKARDFASCLDNLEGFRLICANLSQRHVGRVIVDGVLQVGKGYERQVRPAVNRIMEFDQATTTTGFIKLIENRPLREIVNFKTDGTKSDLLNVAKFFQGHGLNTFEHLYDWLESEDHRDELLTKNSGLKGSVFRIADKTADYFRKLVGHWDAVAVDRGIKELMAKTKVLPRYSTWPYKEKRAIVQLAALELCCTPRDLDSSIYRWYVNGNSKD